VAFLMLADTTTASAQATHVWAEVDCAASRVAPLPGATCRTTNVAAGSEVAGGRSQRHAVVGTTPLGYVYIFMTEAVDSAASIATLKNAIDYLKLISKRAADGSSWSALSGYGGADYHTFKSSEGEACVGFRSFGDRRSLGYAWIMAGLLCVPKGQDLQHPQIVQFIDGARPR
jgi:hypothetical protein